LHVRVFDDTAPGRNLVGQAIARIAGAFDNSGRGPNPSPL